MITKVHSVRDSKAEIFYPPFHSLTHGEAERNFHHLCQDQSSKLNLYPEDFDLYHLGEYDDQTGRFALLDTPQHIIKAVQSKTQTAT